jgi:hypothetical protein
MRATCRALAALGMTATLTLAVIPSERSESRDLHPVGSAV